MPSLDINKLRIAKTVQHSARRLSLLKPFQVYGVVTALTGAIVECEGISNFLSIGETCYIESTVEQKWIMCEVISANLKTLKLLAFEGTPNVLVGSRVRVGGPENLVYPCLSWKGRVINALCNPADLKGRLAVGEKAYSIYASPPAFNVRSRLGPKISLGAKSIDVFSPCCFGQRLGIFAGSGVGKSTLISMLTKYAEIDVKVVGLIGERSREIKEFIEDYLGEEGLKNAVVIASTGDESPVMKKRAAYLTMAVSEYFRDQGLNVLCIIDSLTRLAMAQREIGLISGEFPLAKGYTASVFSELPRLLERAGPGRADKSITGLFTILVEGDDHQEPLSDALRAILDGHIVLSREIAERNRFPAVDVLKSISRAAPACYSEREAVVVAKARKLLSLYKDMEELIRLGIYKSGSNEEVDLAIKHYGPLEEFLTQAPNEFSCALSSYESLEKLLESVP